jgi:integrase/recombinase XerD
VLAGLRLPKKPKTRKEPLTPAEMSSVLDGHDLRTRIGMRDFAILITYLSTGLRASELVALHLDDVHVEAGYLRVRSGKGEKSRVVNLPPETARAILRYRQHHRQPTDDPHLFLTRSGTPLTYDTVNMILAREKRRTGIARLHPHLLRHSFGVASLGSGMDLMTLKETLGHEDIRTTSIYLAMSEQQLVAQQRKSDPLANVRLPKAMRGKARRAS